MTITRPALIRTGALATAAFAATHVYWAAGGTAGIPTGETITDRPVFLAYDIVSAVVLSVAAGVALRLAAAPTTLLTRLTVLGATVALLRGLIGLSQGAVTLVGGNELTIGVGYDVWFAAVGALYLCVVLGGTTRTRSSGPSVDAAIVKPRSR